MRIPAMHCMDHAHGVAFQLSGFIQINRELRRRRGDEANKTFIIASTRQPAI